VERLALVCLGSALGGGARYLLSLGVLRLLGTSFPYGTLTVNVLGSFLIGLIMHVGMETTLISPTARIFLTTGVLGGLTTYSTFNYETLQLATEGDWHLAAGNIAATVFACLAAGILGIAVGRALVGSLASG
jgi:CrcB protein